VRNGRWNHRVCEVTAEVKAVPASRWETPSTARRAVPMTVRSVAYAVSAAASSGSAGGVRIHSSSSGAPLSLASRSVTERVSHGIRSSCTRCSAPRTGGTGEMSWWPGPSSRACMDTAAVAMTPAACRASMASVAKALPS
jgi:hypothetical protein